LLGGKFSNFATLNYKGGLWVAFALLLQFIGVNFLKTTQPTVAGILIIAGFVILLYAVWLNRQFPGMPVVFAGIFLNLLVVSFNGGLMPITKEVLEQINGSNTLVAVTDPNSPATHVTVKTKTGILEDPKLLFLGDIIVIPFPWGKSAVSIGDIVMAVGMTWFCIWVMSVPMFRKFRFTQTNVR
jgi:hypothetical protein